MVWSRRAWIRGSSPSSTRTRWAPPVEHFPDGDLVALHPGVGVAEELDHEVRNVLGGAGFLQRLDLRRTGAQEAQRGQRGAGDQAERRQQRCRDPQPVPPDELPRHVAPASLTRLHRAPLEKIPQIVGQVPHRGVAPVGLLPQRHQHDLVQVPRDTGTAPAGPSGLLVGDRPFELAQRGRPRGDTDARRSGAHTGEPPGRRRRWRW